MKQACRLAAGIFFILGSFLAVSRLAQNDGTTLAEARAQRLRSRQAAQDEKVDIEKAAALFLNEETSPKPDEPKDDLLSVYEQLDDLSECNRTLDTPLLRLLLNSSANSLEKHETESKTLYLAHLIAKHTYLASAQTMPLNATLTSTPVARPQGRSPIHVLQLICDEKTDYKRWMPMAIYPTSVANSFLQVQLPQIQINACSFAHCRDSKCSATTHSQLKVFARSCCGSQRVERRFCRSDWRAIQNAFYIISAIFIIGSIIMVPIILRERNRQQQESRGWALMELFFLGAIILYLIPLIDLVDPEKSGCIVAVWFRELGFTLFYGSIILKIYRNLQEYRVRKAHHVIVHERDLLKYLAYGIGLTLIGLMFWTLGAWKTDSLFNSQWPQCPFEKWSVAWSVFELLVLLYGVRLCYKARSSSWVERYQFTVAVCLELLVSSLAQLIRYSLRHTGSSDILFITSVVQLHLTVSVNIAAIIAPKFIVVSTDSNRRTLTMSGANSGRAHPSLAKLRDNLINGTIDFAEVPIIDMNPDDIRAELKRVYTQLRMYKVKNIYQENPHISKRKGGKKISDKTACKNRRISIPPTSSSPKIKRVNEEDEEKSDLTVESAPHNVYLSTNKMRKIESNDQQSVRV